MSDLYPNKIFRSKENQLVITWNNKKTHFYSLYTLRTNCPCAKCVDEWSGKRISKKEDLNPKVTPTRLFSVGQYAIAIEWDDGHKSGIYDYPYLYTLSK